jgi:glycerophosphoryl diester phosphodiesterase
MFGATSRILVHGHRGARAVRPENTLPAFEYAIGVGADAIELDIAVTRDDVLVVSHDPVLTQPDTVIRERTLAELNHRIPTLDEVFTLAAPGRVELNLELKSFPDKPEFTPPPEEFVRLLLKLIRQHGMAQRCMVQSFDFRTLRAKQALAPEIRRGALTEDDPRDFVAIAWEAGDTHYVAPHYSLVTPEKVRAAHGVGIQVVAWTVNTPEDWARMAEAQVDAIVTDDPAALIAWLK